MRLAEQEAEGVEMPEGMERDELTLRILVAAEGLGRVQGPGRFPAPSEPYTGRSPIAPIAGDP
jgi:hypothetical protein